MSAWTRYDVVPVAKPRMTQRDTWKQRPIVMRYRAYKDMLRVLNVQLPEHAQVVFVVPMPKTWRPVQRHLRRGKAHCSRPDVDNLHKGLLDAIYNDDSGVWDARITKVWGDVGAIYVREIEPPELPTLAFQFAVSS